jgi:hypothetical protein
MQAPGTCADCGNDAYIRLASDGDGMLCAHCFATHREERRAAGPDEIRSREPAPPPGAPAS